MKEIVVLSGKGGTGKTTVVASLAALATSKLLCDCDVDAADLHLLLEPQIKEEREFWSGKVATIDAAQCTRCGLCQELCRFDAIKDFAVDSVACEGCGFCYRVCPEEAIAMEENLAGHWFVSETRYGPLVHAKLGPAQENSGKLVAVVRQQARIIAHKQGLPLVLSDGPPGIGCPVISSLTGASLALIVTEPTPSGSHDMERILQVCRHFQVPSAVCINKYDLDEENSRGIEGYCRRYEVPLLARIPFDDGAIEAIRQGMPLVEYSDGAASREIERLWHRLSSAEEVMATSTPKT
jgi:MinD superfamily P-loop ATPase